MIPMRRIDLITHVIQKMKSYVKALPPAALPAPAAAPAAPASQFAGQCQNCAKNRFNGGCEAYRHIPGKFLTGIEKCRYHSPKKDPAQQEPQKPASPASPAAPRLVDLSKPVLPSNPATFGKDGLVEDAQGEVLVPAQTDNKLPLPPGFDPKVPGKGQCFRCKKNKLNGSCEAYTVIPGEFLSGINKCPSFTNKDPILQNPLQELNRPEKNPK
jgi:hypothetical protein